MRVVYAVKTGDMKNPDPEKRGAVEIIDEPLREINDDELLIKVAYCAICGSDPHVIGGIFGWDPPFGMGHELSGIVEQVGKNVKNGFKPGDKVAGNFRHYCGSCYYCTNGMEQFCENAIEAPCMAEYVIWHEKQAFKIPESVSLKNGCLMEPVSVALRAVEKTGVKVGQNAIISGGGPIGLLALQILNLYGATNLTLLEPNPARRELALKYGAKYALDPLNEDVRKKAMDITQGVGFDVLIELSAIPSSAELLIDISAYAAHLVYLAQYPRDYNLPLNLYDQLYTKELTITGSIVSPYGFTRTSRIMERLYLDDFTAKVFCLDDVKEAFDAHLSGKYPKIVLKCNTDIE